LVNSAQTNVIGSEKCKKFFVSKNIVVILLLSVSFSQVHKQVSY